MTPVDQLRAIKTEIDTLHAMNRQAMRRARGQRQTILAAFNRDAARLALLVRTELQNGQINRDRYGRWGQDVAELRRQSEYYRASGRRVAA